MTSPKHANAPPPIPQERVKSQDQMSKTNHLVVRYFWYIIAGAALVKIIAYFIAPPENATAGYHFWKLLIGFISYGGILALISFVLAKIVRSRAHVFKIAFAVLFSLACLLDLTTAVLRHQAYAAGTKLLESFAASEALMQHEDNPDVVEKTISAGKSFFAETETHVKNIAMLPSSGYAKGAGIEWDILNEEANDLHRAGNYRRAVVVAKEALKVARENVGSDHPDMATSLNNLAELYRAQGHYAKAEPLYKRSLKIDEAALGPDHPSVATSLNNLALLYRATKRSVEAQKLEARAARIHATPR